MGGGQERGGPGRHSTGYDGDVHLHATVRGFDRDISLSITYYMITIVLIEGVFGFNRDAVLELLWCLYCLWVVTSRYS